MSRNKFIQDVVWVLILVLYPNLLNVSIIIKSRKDIYSCTLQIIFNFPSTFENDIKESTSNIDKEFNTKSDISFDYNLKIVDIIFLMG